MSGIAIKLMRLGKIKGRRRKATWLQNLRNLFRFLSLFRSAVSKVLIAIIIAKLHRGGGGPFFDQPVAIIIIPYNPLPLYRGNIC